MVDFFFNSNIFYLLAQLVQYVCEFHREKIGDRLGRFPFTLSFIGVRLLPDPKLIAENKAAVYLITEDPNMPLPPMENEEIIYPLAREMSREEQMGLLFKAMDKLGIQSQRQKESKNKSKSKSKGQHSRRKK